MTLKGLRIGFALTGSFCTFDKIFTQMQAIKDEGALITPILSENAYNLDTRFFPAATVRQKVEEICQTGIRHTLPAVEPIGPKKEFDLLVVAPLTGNTLGKLAAGITDTPVSMAVKSHLRNGRPVLLAISTNDGLAASAPNLGRVLGQKHMYFVPFGQDDANGKPNSLVAHMEMIPEAARFAAEGVQMQPVLRDYQ